LIWRGRGGPSEQLDIRALISSGATDPQVCRLKQSNLFYPCLILADEAAGKGKKESFYLQRGVNNSSQIGVGPWRRHLSAADYEAALFKYKDPAKDAKLFVNNR